jgi:hypothetical protein
MGIVAFFYSTKGEKMKRLKVVGIVLAALLVIVTGAKASGVIGVGHEDDRYDSVEAKAERLAQKLEAQAGEGPVGAAERPGRRGPRGPRGPKGAHGAQGPAGPQGTFGSVISVNSSPVFLCSFEAGSCAVGSTRADCPPGTVLTGGGYTGAGIVTTVTWSAPVGNSWGVIAVNLDEVPVNGLKAVAECASS